MDLYYAFEGQAADNKETGYSRLESLSGLLFSCKIFAKIEVRIILRERQVFLLVSSPAALEEWVG